MARRSSSNQTNQSNPETPSTPRGTPGPDGDVAVLSNAPVEPMPEQAGQMTQAAANAVKPTSEKGPSRGAAEQAERDEEERQKLEALKAQIAAEEDEAKRAELERQQKEHEAAVEAAKPKVYRALNDKMINTSGFRVMLRAGKEVSSKDYNIRHLRGQGARLQRINPETGETIVE